MDADVRAELMAEVDEEWAERLRHLPMKAGQPDPDRQVAELHALLRTGEREQNRARKSRAQIAAGGGVLRLDRTAYADITLRQHDKIVALDRRGEPVFEVLSVDDRSHLRLICELGDAN